MTRKDLCIIILSMVICGLATIMAIEANKPKLTEIEFLCKQVYEIKTKFNIVLECNKTN